MKRIGVGFFETTPEMRYNVSNVLESGRISYGPLCERLEEDFRVAHNVEHAVCCGSGTDALRLALMAMKIKNGWRDGDEVIVPALTFVATVNVVLQCNLTPVLADVQFSGNLDPVKAFVAETDRTRAVLPVHLFGQPANVDLIRAYFPDALIIEDSCECMLATHNGRSVGRLGDIAAFSFYMAHLVTAGVGGMVTTNDKSLADLCRSLANHGRDTSYWNIDMESRIQSRFRFHHVGYSTRMTELQAALALPQLARLDEMIERRNQIATKYIEAFSPMREVKLVDVEDGNSHSYMMFPMLVTNSADKWALCDYLEERGVETRECLPLTNQPVYANLFNEDDYPVAKLFNNNSFYIPCHQGMSDEDVDYVIETIKGYFA